jgi:hypothetical protein
VSREARRESRRARLEGTVSDDDALLCNEILGEELGVTQRLSRAAVALEKAAAGEELFRDRHSEAVAELLAAARELRATPCPKASAARKLVPWPSGGQPSTATGR